MAGHLEGEQASVQDSDKENPVQMDDWDTQTVALSKDRIENEASHKMSCYESEAATESDDGYIMETPENIFNLEDLTDLGQSPPVETESDSDNESPDSDYDIKKEIERRRAWSLQMQQAFFEKMQSGIIHTNLIAEATSRTNNTQKPKKHITVHRRRSGDPSFRFTGYIPSEKRKSARLQNMNPEFKYTDLPDDVNTAVKRRRFSTDDLSHIEDIVYKPKISRVKKIGQSRTPIIAVEDVTEAMLSQIATKSSAKILDPIQGTSCHQCRQKTTDTKTCCRNVDCVGVRGQFCGCCIKNRYGEDAAVALLDPTWTCFVCRGICNCSFCRAKAGKKPTGILAPLVQKYGYNSVQQFLDKAKSKVSAKDVLGFTSDYAHTKDGKTKPLINQYKTLQEIEAENRNRMNNSEDKENKRTHLFSDTDSSSSDDEDVTTLANKNIVKQYKTSNGNRFETQQKESVEVVHIVEEGTDDNTNDTEDTFKKPNGVFFRISGNLFGSGRRNKKLESPASKKQTGYSKKLLGFSINGKEAVIEGGICVPLYKEQ